MSLLLCGCVVSSSSLPADGSRNTVAEARKVERQMLDLFAEHDLYLMPIRPANSEKDFYLPFELARLLRSGALQESGRQGGTDHEILVRFAREVLLEDAADLAGLPEHTRRALTHRPQSLSAWWSQQRESFDPFDAPPGLNFDEARELRDYLGRREVVRTSSSLRTEEQILEGLASLDGVMFKAPCFDRVLLQQCQSLISGASPTDDDSAASEVLADDLRSRCFDLQALAACEEATYFLKEVDHIQDDVLALMVSALFKVQAPVPSPERSWWVSLIEDILNRLVATSTVPVGAIKPPDLVVTDKPFSRMGMSGHVFGLTSDLRHYEIQISPALLRAIPARCASSGRAVMLLMQARKDAAAESSASLYDHNEAALIAALETRETDSEPIVSVTLLPLLPHPGSLSDQQISDSRILDFVDDYWSCIEQSVTFPLVHELAHLFLQLRCQGGDTACELRADCHALAHLESLEQAAGWSGVRRLGFFFEIMVQSIEQGYSEFVAPYQTQADTILERYAKIQAGACQPSDTSGDAGREDPS